MSTSALSINQKNLFTVMKPENEEPVDVNAPTFFEDQKKSIDEQIATWEAAKKKVEEEERAAAENTRVKKVNRRDACLSEAATLRELAVKADADNAYDFIQKAKTLELEASSLAAELGFDPMPVVEEEPVKGRDISTTKGLYGMIILAIITAIAFYLFGTSLIQGEDNESAQRMMNSVGLRIITNFLPTSLAFLSALGILYLIFPHQFNYFHNRINSEFSLKKDLEAALPWQRILFFSFALSLPVWVFVQLMQVIFG